MRILLVHNAYQIPGGEDVVFASEAALLRERGHDVREFLVKNDNIVGLREKLAAAIGVVFSLPMYRKLRLLLRTWRPDVVHVHNFFPLISPAVFYACKAERVPVVMTLHNYRVLCPTALLMHDGRVTERSLTAGPWWGVRRKVYRGSLLGSAALALMISVHKALGTWQRKVDRFIVLSQFARSKFIEGGLPAEKLVCKPNFAVATVPSQGSPRAGFLYLGRLSEEKGLACLAQASAPLDTPVRVAGTGPLESALLGWPHLIGLGQLSRSEAMEEMRRAIALVVPSLWYEGFPMVIVEAFSAGTPIIASRIGSLGELIEDGVTGLLVDPGNSSDLQQKMAWAQAHPAEMEAMGRTARQRYEALYTEDVNYQRLIEIYQEAIQAGERPGPTEGRFLGERRLSDPLQERNPT